jgi:Cu/Ag efflux pump CusA
MISREMNRRFVTVRMNLRGKDLTSFMKEAESKIEAQVRYGNWKVLLSTDTNPGFVKLIEHYQVR